MGHETASAVNVPQAFGCVCPHEQHTYLSFSASYTRLITDDTDDRLFSNSLRCNDLDDEIELAGSDEELRGSSA